MPLYDYQCEKCNAVFEVERKMSDTHRQKCSACGSAKTVKVFNAAGIVFKGSGFYVTDSKNGSSASTPPVSSSSDKTEGTKTEKPESTVKPAKQESTKNNTTDKD